MKIKLSPLFVLAGLTLAATHIQAASLVDGSAEAGKARALTCTACHGPEGNSASPMWPNIAGQNAPYLLAQLKAFKDGSRVDPLMSSQAMMLSDEDMANLAVYFESLPAAAQSIADESLLERGEALYRGGNKEDKISACLACHGPTGPMARARPMAKLASCRTSRRISIKTISRHFLPTYRVSSKHETTYFDNHTHLPGAVDCRLRQARNCTCARITRC
jgi:cytochrome c553